jgi:hypothetical protein
MILEITADGQLTLAHTTQVVLNKMKLGHSP